MANRIDARRRQPPGYSPSRPQVLSDIPSPDNNLSLSPHQFRYLIGTRHHDDDEGGDWETMRVAQEGDNVVVYRRQVIGNGTKLSRSEDGPIWALDVVHMTLAYKRRGRANTATWTDSDSDGYRKRDDSDSDVDNDDHGRLSKGNTSKPYESDATGTYQ